MAIRSFFACFAKARAADPAHAMARHTHADRLSTVATSDPPADAISTPAVGETRPIATQGVHIQQDTSSAHDDSERRFRDVLRQATDIVFQTGHRADWMVDAATGCNLELAMLDDYTHPSRCTKANDGFDASCARDAPNDTQCAAHGVTLLRGRAVGDVHSDIAMRVVVLASHVFLDSMRPPT
jgi:hypothetical protein